MFGGYLVVNGYILAPSVREIPVITLYPLNSKAYPVSTYSTLVVYFRQLQQYHFHGGLQIKIITTVPRINLTTYVRVRFTWYTGMAKSNDNGDVDPHFHEVKELESKE
jgi:hypothetical protein